MDFNFIIENIPKYLEAMKLTVIIGIFGSPKYKKNNCITSGVFLESSI